MDRDRDTVQFLRGAMFAFLIIALMFVFWLVATVAHADEPGGGDPFAGIQAEQLSLDEICDTKGECKIQRDMLERIGLANHILMNRLARAVADKVKKCATLIPERRS